MVGYVDKEEQMGDVGYMEISNGIWVSYPNVKDADGDVGVSPEVIERVVCG